MKQPCPIADATSIFIPMNDSHMYILMISMRQYIDWSPIPRRIYFSYGTVPYYYFVYRIFSANIFENELSRGVPRILPGAPWQKGGMHIFGWHTPFPPDPDPHQDFELDPDPALDPHQNNVDPQPWAQLSKDCCLIYNYV